MDKLLIDDPIARRVCDIYKAENSIKAVSRFTGLSEWTVRKILITAGLYDSDRVRQINELRAQGKTISEIAELLNITTSMVTGYIPYQRAMHCGLSKTANAQKIAQWRRRKERG